MKNLIIILSFLLYVNQLFSQNFESLITSLEREKELIENQKINLDNAIDSIRMLKIKYDLKQIGLPSENYIEHSAMILEYSEQHEQAKWVSHIIIPEVIESNLPRSNDFRIDEKVLTGSAQEEDYFIKVKDEDGEYEYDGFGYDRGHLAPSADFRWSEKAMSESYLYSNMSPQIGEFNREKWAEVEGFFRTYIANHPTTQLYVVTAPVLNDSLPYIERSVNKVSIPNLYIKAVLDLNNQRGICFIMPNKKITSNIEEFTYPIDKAEEILGLDLFSKLDDNLENKIESQLVLKEWKPESSQNDTEPLNAELLPRKHFNTTQAKYQVGEKAKICGTPVGSRKSRKGNVWFYVDKSAPNQEFQFYIKKEDLVNFQGDPEKLYLNKCSCFIGNISKLGDTPTIQIEKAEQIESFKL